MFTFQRIKSGEIIERIKTAEKEVKDLVDRVPDTSQSNGGEDDQRDLPTELDYQLLEEDLAELISDVYGLANFRQLNYTGFMKIIKKHDVGLYLGILSEKRFC